MGSYEVMTKIADLKEDQTSAKDSGDSKSNKTG